MTQLGKPVEDRPELGTDGTNPQTTCPVEPVLRAEPTLQGLPQAPIIWSCPVSVAPPPG